jgi:hypothetical protein
MTYYLRPESYIHLAFFVMLTLKLRLTERSTLQLATVSGHNLVEVYYAIVPISVDSLLTHEYGSDLVMFPALPIFCSTALC